MEISSHSSLITGNMELTNETNENATTSTNTVNMTTPVVTGLPKVDGDATGGAQCPVEHANSPGTLGTSKHPRFPRQALRRLRDVSPCQESQANAESSDDAQERVRTHNEREQGPGSVEMEEKVESDRYGNRLEEVKTAHKTRETGERGRSAARDSLRRCQSELGEKGSPINRQPTHPLAGTSRALASSPPPREIEICLAIRTYPSRTSHFGHVLRPEANTWYKHVNLPHLCIMSYSQFLNSLGYKPGGSIDSVCVGVLEKIPEAEAWGGEVREMKMTGVVPGMRGKHGQVWDIASGEGMEVVWMGLKREAMERENMEVGTGPMMVVGVLIKRVG
ncbi:hypothetical protein BDZ91DRAFT_766069 [Kalaharituber pfeilii]|nr:hypothetical protein BDZ91DRAFT_766069 [Kalaharituber pfeilii]